MSWRSLPFGRIAVASFIVCTLTGVFLTFFYEPSVTPVTYDGPYAPLIGTEMSRALESALRISLEVPGGLLIRQLHHWSSSIMIAALLMQILRVFFTGRFRRRRLGWLVLFGLLFAGMGAGLTGHLLPDDMLSGNSLAVLDGLLKGVPFVGTELSDLVFQGRYPSGAIATSYPAHVYVLPAVMVALLAVQAVLGRRDKPAGIPLGVRAGRHGALFFAVFGVLTLLATTVTVNPIWSYGPARAGNASAGTGALWYLAFLDGAQRLVPPGWEFVWLNRTWTIAILAPVAVSGLFLVTAMLYPFIEPWFAGGRPAYHRPARPRDTPVRTGIGVAGVVFYGVLWAAAGSDTIAFQFDLAVEGVVHTLQAALLLGPVIGYVLTKRICLGLQLRDHDEALHGHETGRIIQLPSGGYVEVREEPESRESRPLKAG